MGHLFDFWTSVALDVVTFMIIAFTLKFTIIEVGVKYYLRHRFYRSAWLLRVILRLPLHAAMAYTIMSLSLFNFPQHFIWTIVLVDMAAIIAFNVLWFKNRKSKCVAGMKWGDFTAQNLFYTAFCSTLAYGAMIA